VHLVRASPHRNASELTEAFRVAFANTDKQLSQHEYFGCTATTLYIWQLPHAAGNERFLQCANVGDSTAFLCRRGQAVQLSEDHKVASQKEKERIRAMGATVADTQGRVAGLTVSRALGDWYAKQEKCGIVGDPFVSPPYRIEAEDTFVIVASDGLWDCMSGQQAVDLIRDQVDAVVAAKLLLEHALKSAKCQDNVTILCARL